MSESSAELLTKTDIRKMIRFVQEYIPKNQTHIHEVLSTLLTRKKTETRKELSRAEQFEKFQIDVNAPVLQLFADVFEENEHTGSLYVLAMQADREAFRETKEWLIDAILDTRERGEVAASVKGLSPKKFIERLKKDSRLQQLVAEELRSYEFE